MIDRSIKNTLLSIYIAVDYHITDEAIQMIMFSTQCEINDSETWTRDESVSCTLDAEARKDFFCNMKYQIINIIFGQS